MLKTAGADKESIVLKKSIPPTHMYVRGLSNHVHIVLSDFYLPIFLLPLPGRWQIH